MLAVYDSTFCFDPFKFWPSCGLNICNFNGLLVIIVAVEIKDKRRLLSKLDYIITTVGTLLYSGINKPKENDSLMLQFTFRTSVISRR